MGSVSFLFRLEQYGIFYITGYLLGVFEEDIFLLALGASQDHSVFTFAF